MRISPLVAGFALALPAVTAHAQNVGFDVTGSAPQVCAVQEPQLAAAATINIRSLSGNSLQIEDLVDSQTLSTKAASAEVSFDAVCTFPHRIVMQSQNNGLWRNSASGVTRPPGFADGVPYTAVLNWGDTTDQLDADATSRGSTQQVTPIGNAVVGALTIDFSVQPGASNLAANSPLLAGIYSDILTVTLEPQ